MTQTVIGVFENSNDAYQAVEKLTNSGYSRDQIDLAENDKNYNPDQVNHEDDSISRFFSNLFGNKEQASYYSEVSRRSSNIVTVHAQNNEDAQRAVEILDEYGAIDIDERASQYGYNISQETTQDNSLRDDSPTRETGDSKSIPIIEEELHVGKRQVESGGARIRSRIIKKPVEETLRLRQESVNIERNPVNRPASEGDLDHFKEGEINVTERSEVPVVNKEARVVEEVKINKEVNERQENVRENVRKTEVDIENHDEGEIRDRRDDL